LKAKVWASAGGVIGAQKCERTIVCISSLETVANCNHLPAFQLGRKGITIQAS
jgi:hypothetical protein